MRTRVAALLAVFLVSLAVAPRGAAGPKVLKPTGSGVQTIYVVHTSHWDYGFTDPPQNLPAKFRAHLNDVIAKVQADPRHRYTIESVWALEDYISVATPSEVSTLMSLVRQGRIAVSSAYTGPHSGVMSAEEINRWIHRAGRLRDQYQIPSRAAVVNDNPGHTWALPDALAASGVDRLVCGPNHGLSQEFPLPLAETLFRWQGPAGRQVLTWVSRDGYPEGIEFWQIDANAARLYHGSQHPEWAGWTRQQIMEQGITTQLNRLEQAGYPYDAVLVLMAHDTLNYDSSGQLLGDILQWNATHASPQIKLATADEFFDHMVSTYGWDAFPVKTGNWVQRWDRVKVYGQMVQSRFREVRDGLLTAEKLASFASLLGAEYPAAPIDAILRDLLRFGDHGAGPNLTVPHGLTAAENDMNNLYWTQTSLAHLNGTRSLVASGAAALAARIATGPSPTLAVFNPLSATRTAHVVASVPGVSQPFALRDAETGAAVPYQARQDGTIEFVAKDVPALGYKSYRVLAGVADPPPAGVTASGAVVESPFYRVTVSPTTGAITSIVDKTNGNRELVNASSRYQFNRTVRADNSADYIGGNATDLTTGTPTVTAAPGPVSGSLTITFSSPGTTLASPLSRVEVRLYRDVPRVDIVDTFDKSRLQYTVNVNRHSEHFYAPLPLNLNLASFAPRVESNAPAFLRPPSATYLVGPALSAVNNSHTPPHGVVMRDTAAGFQVEVASPEVFLFNIGSLNSWSYNPPEATLLAEPLVKVDRTLTDDPGFPAQDFVVEPLEDNPSVGHTIYTARFSITSGPSRADSASLAFGAGVATPLAAVLVPAGQSGPLPGASLSLLSSSAPNVEIHAVKRPDFGDPADVIVRVREIDGVATTAALASAFRVLAAAECDLLETPLAAISPAPLVVSLAPYQTKTLRLRLGQLDPLGAQTAGVYVPGTGAWFLRNANGPGSADSVVAYGAPNMGPLSGDWDGDGRDSLGVFDAGSSTFFLKNALAPGPADLAFNFGPPGTGWVPIAGDWDGDGADTVGLYDAANGAFFLKNTNGSGPADMLVFYGPPGAVPVVGDWNGDGIDTVGIYVPPTGAFFLRNSNTPGAADLAFFYGPPGATPVAGDWNGDRVDTVGVYVPPTAAFFLRDSNTPGNADYVFPYGAPGAVPVMGDWDGR